MKEKICFALLLLTISLSAQTSKENLTTKIDSLTSVAFFDTAAISVDVFDLTTQEQLYQKKNKLLLRPASNMKILTTASALYFLGEQYPFQTLLYYDGFIIDSTLYGNLYFKGGCDPDFTTKDLSELISHINKLGLKQIFGNIYGDVSMLDSLFWGNGWMWDDDPSTDFPYFTPLVINDNAVKVLVTPGEINKAASIQLVPATAYCAIQNETVTVNDGRTNLEITRDFIHRKNDVIVKGTINANRGTYSDEINVFNPALYFLSLAKENLERTGIECVGNIDTMSVPGDAKIIGVVERKFSEVIGPLNKQSDNLSAEMTLRALSNAFYGKPATAKNGIILVDSLITLVGKNPSDYRIVDGSGVSHYNLVSTELLDAVLKYFYLQKPNLYEILSNSFPIAGVDGTLRNRMKGTLAENNVHAKTGTISGVSSLSGYVKSKNNHMLSFSIMVQNHVRKTYRATYYIDNICEVLAGYE